MQRSDGIPVNEQQCVCRESLLLSAMVSSHGVSHRVRRVSEALICSLEPVARYMHATRA
jgi:hypothetical protein